MTDVIIATRSRGSTPVTYHTTRCNVVDSMTSSRTITQTQAEQRGLRLCKRCDPEHEAHHKNDFSFYMAAKRAGEAND